MKQALIVQDLAHMNCGNPDCIGEHPVYIIPTCHPTSGVDVAYEKDRATMLVQCHECRTPICEIAVAAATTH